MAKNVWSAKEIMTNDFAKRIIKEQLGRDETNLTADDYILMDDRGHLHIHNTDTQGFIDTDKFKSSNYTNDGQTVDEEDFNGLNNLDEDNLTNKKLYNQNKFLNKINDYINKKGSKIARNEIKKYLKRYYKWDDLRINKFLNRLKRSTTKIYKKLDNFNIRKKLENNLKDLLAKKIRMEKTNVFKNNFSKFLKKDFPSKTFNNMIKGALSDTIGDISLEDLIFDLLLF